MTPLEIIRWATRQRIANAVAKNVLVALATHASMRDGRAQAHPSQRLLAEHTAYSERSVRMALAYLEETGILQREIRRRGGGSRTTDLIILLVEGSDKRQVVPLAVKPGQSPISGRRFPSPRNRIPSSAESDSALTTFEVPEEGPGEETPVAPEGGRHAPASLGCTREAKPALLFDVLLTTYPRDGRAWADLDAARRSFGELSPADQAAAIGAAPAYARFCEERRRTPYSLQRWLRKRLWHNEPGSGESGAAAIPAEHASRVFVEADTPAWDAWAAHLRAQGQRPPFTFRSDVHRAEGAHFDSAWPPVVEPVRTILELSAP